MRRFIAIVVFIEFKLFERVLRIENFLLFLHLPHLYAFFLKVYLLTPVIDSLHILLISSSIVGISLCVSVITLEIFYVLKGQIVRKQRGKNSLVPDILLLIVVFLPVVYELDFRWEVTLVLHHV